jgi:hypothetical protein
MCYCFVGVSVCSLGWLAGPIWHTWACVITRAYVLLCVYAWYNIGGFWRCWYSDVYVTCGGGGGVAPTWVHEVATISHLTLRRERCPITRFTNHSSRYSIIHVFTYRHLYVHAFASILLLGETWPTPHGELDSDQRPVHDNTELTTIHMWYVSVHLSWWHSLCLCSCVRATLFRIGLYWDVLGGCEWTAIPHVHDALVIIYPGVSCWCNICYLKLLGCIHCVFQYACMCVHLNVCSQHIYVFKNWRPVDISYKTNMWSQTQRVINICVYV